MSFSATDAFVSSGLSAIGSKYINIRITNTACSVFVTLFYLSLLVFLYLILFVFLLRCFDNLRMKMRCVSDISDRETWLRLSKLYQVMFIAKGLSLESTLMLCIYTTATHYYGNASEKQSY